MSVVTLTDAKTHLRMPLTDTSQDSAIQGFIDAATLHADFWFGPTSTRTVTNEVHDGGFPTILLRIVPVQSVTTLIEYVGLTPYVLTAQPPGSTVNSYGYSLDDPAAGLVVRRSGAGTPQEFLGGERSVVVTYVAGLATVPADIRLAALEDIRGLWQQTQQGGRPAFSGSAQEDTWNVGSLHLFPRLAELAAGPSRTPSIA